MKYIWINLIVLLICSNIFFQNKSELYDKIIFDIENSKELEEFTISHNINKLNFKVKQYLYPFCENYNMFKKENLNKEIIETCINDNWFSSELERDDALKNKCSKGKKTLILYFTNTVDNYIIAEIVVKKAEQESLLFLYKFDNEALIEKVESIHIFKN
jgi:hypothetical protein